MVFYLVPILYHQKGYFSCIRPGLYFKNLWYYFKCVITDCDRSFDRIKDCNLHHWVSHKTCIQCTICKKWFTTPKSHRARRNTHAPHKFTCPACQKTFSCESRVRLHRRVHSKSKLFKCFSGSCKNMYKWPKDLT